MIAAIQAGGRSSRMGVDKAWVSINGRPMIEHVLTAAQPVADHLAIVVHPASPNLARYAQLAAQWNAELLHDVHDYRGPLGGIETALQRSENDEAVLMLACDLPFVTTKFLQLLGEIHQVEQADLTVPLDAEERPQMLAAIYGKACLAQVSALLAVNELKAQLLQARVATRCVNFAEYAHLPNARRLLLNVNTLEDYRQMEG